MITSVRSAFVPGRARPVSRVVAALGLVVALPVMVLTAVAIKASSRGPVLFRAVRAGRRGLPFTMLKFRTMHLGRHVGGGRITGGRDARVFTVGRWLRRFKLDELPQLVNVVRGHMALVGPRPEDPSIVQEHYTPFMHQSLTVLPGLTSPGSLGYYADEANLPDDPEEAERLYLRELLPRKIAVDLVYVVNRSWRYDMELVARTAASMIGLRRLFTARQAWERHEATRLLRGPAAAPEPRHAGVAR